MKKANAPKKVVKKKAKKGKGAGEASDESDGQYAENLIPENDAKRQQMLIGHLEKCSDLVEKEDDVQVS